MSGQFSEVEFLATEVFGDLRRGFFIEAGAFDGEAISNTLFFEAKQVRTMQKFLTHYVSFNHDYIQSNLIDVPPYIMQ